MTYRKIVAPAMVLLLHASTAGAAAAQEVSLPSRKPGLWEIVTVTQKPDKVPKVSVRVCIDAATDRELMEFGLKMSKDTCSRYDARGKGANWTIEAECAMGPVKSVTRTRIGGDFQSRVNISIDGTVTGMPGSNGPQPTQMSQEGRWISADCPGLKPGDMLLEGGTKINVKDMRQLRKLLPNIQIR